jgi:hypothetical protein
MDVAVISHNYLLRASGLYASEKNERSNKQNRDCFLHAVT